MIGRAFWRETDRAAQAWGPVALSVFASILYRMVVLEVLWNRVYYLPKRWGGHMLSVDSPPEDLI